MRFQIICGTFASMKKIITIITVCLLPLGNIHALDLSTHKLNVPADGKAICTAQLQAAIDRISAKGGGRLIFTSGQYLTGGLRLKSGVELFFEKDATLLGSVNPYDYSSVVTTAVNDGRNDNASMALITADNVENIAITGHGTIDGQGLQLALSIDSLHHTGERIDTHYNERRQRPSELARPKLIFFHQCKNVRVSDMHLQSSANWGLSFDLCENIRLSGLTIVNRAYWNNDGIDLTDCTHVVIDNCDINSADEGI